MHFYNKAIILGLMLLVLFCLPWVYPTNLMVFISVIGSVVLLAFLVFMVLKDDTRSKDEKTDEIPIP